jgi:uncharacterized membrane protein
LYALGLAWLVRARALHRRPVLLTFAALGAVPLLSVLLEWSGLVRLEFVRFERPVLAGPLALVLLYSVGRLLGLPERMQVWRRRLSELFLSCSALALSLAALGTELGRPLDRLAVIVAIDRSRSIDLVQGAEARLLAELEVAELGMRDDDRIGTLAFGATASIEDPLRPRSRAPAPQVAEVARDGTDLAAAMRRALSEVPADSAARIVLVTDGVATRGDTMAAAAVAAAAGVPIDAVPLDQGKIPDIRVVAVRASPVVSEGEAMELSVVTSATATTAAELRLYRDGKLIRRGEVSLPAGEDVLRLRETAAEPGLHRYDVELTARDAALDQAHEDNAGAAFVRVRGPSSALVIEGETDKARPLLRALEGAAFRTQVAGMATVPADVATLAMYDVVVLSDVPASALSPAQLESFAVYVRDLGGGLVLMGGDRSMGPGGYAQTPVEEVSPVSFDLKQDRRRASLAEIIAIDYSGSMGMEVGGRTKLDLANEAAARSARLLGAGDRLGVMHVDTKVTWTIPLAPVTDTDAIARKIRAVKPGGGGIYVDLTLEQAYSALGRETVNLKHLLLFADGSDAEERQRAFSLVSQAKSRGITTSVVALGRGADVAALERMSRLGDGRFYLIEDAHRLPAVFAQETILASRSAINEVTFKPRPRSSAPLLRGIDLGAAPALDGYVVTIPKARAQIHLEATDGDPLLAVWSVGLGRAAAFTSDYKDRWGSAWTDWAHAARLFAQVARDVARRADDARVRLEASALGGELRVHATVTDDRGRSESFRRLRVHVAGPSNAALSTPLEATSSGSYSAALPVLRPGAYIATAVDEATGEAVATAGAVASFGEELTPTGTDRATLRRVTELTGGKLRENLAGIFREREARRFAYSDVTALLFVLAAIALVLGVAARRLVLPDALVSLPERIRDGAMALRHPTAPRVPEAAPHDALGALRAARDRRANRDGDLPRAEAGLPALLPTHTVARPQPSPQATPRPDEPRERETSLTAAEILLRRRKEREGRR